MTSRSRTVALFLSPFAIGATLLAALFLQAGTAQSVGDVFNADFNSDAVGNPPSASPPGPPVGDSISVQTPQQSTVTVVGPGAAFGTNSVEFVRVAEIGGSPILNAKPVGAKLSSGQYTVSWRAAAGQANGFFGFGAVVDPSNFGVVTVNYSGATISYQDSLGSQDTSVAYAANVPKLFTVDVDLDAKRFDFCIDGVLVGNDGQFQDTGFTGLDRFLFQIGGTFAETYQVDDINISGTNGRCDGQATAAPTVTASPTGTATSTATPTPPPTPTPSATPLPLFAFLPLPDILPIVLGTPDLSIHGIEITQAVQCFDTSNGLAGCPDNSLPVVAQKHTTARIYPRYSGPFTQMAGVPVRLHIFANGVEYIANTFGTAKTFIDQANNDSANIWFNVNFLNDVNVSFYAVVDPDNVVAETNESNNRFPASGTITMNFERRDTEKIVGWRMRYHPSGFTGNQFAGGWAVNGGGADYLEDAWPVKSNNGVPYSIKSGYYDRTTVITAGNTGAILDDVTEQWVLQNWFSFFFGTGAFTGADQVFVWTPRDFFVRGLSDPAFVGGPGIAAIGDDTPGTSIDDPGFGAVNFAHEVTHNQNVKHTGTGVGCDNSPASSPPWPYSNAKIQEFGYNPDTSKIFDPSSSYDFMSYCYGGNLADDAWISPFHWNRVFNSVPASLGGIFPQGLQPATSEESLVVNATIDNPDIDGDDGGQLGDLHLADVGLELLPPPGDYAIELRDGDAVLLSQSFDVAFEPVQGIGIIGDPFSPLEPRSEVMVSFIMPWADGTTSVALVNNGTTLDEFFPSANVPTVSFTSPAGPEAWPAGSTQTLSWEGSDVDGDDLTYSLTYSVDGIEWEIIDAGLTGTSYQIETDSLAGADAATFRVVVTDGINVASDETPPITVPNKAPMVAITDPVPGTVITPGGLALFNATAVDLEDDDLPDDAFSWSSDVDGDLGSGASLPINTLSNGPHTVTLTVEDSDGASSQATVDVLVAVPAFVDVVPDVISPAGSPPVVTVIVILPFGYPTDTLDTDSLQMIIGTETLDPTSVESLGDTDSDGLSELKLTFDGAAVQNALPGGVGTASARIVGETDGGIGIQGSDAISQVSAGDANCDGSINPVDSLTVLRYDAGLPVTATEDCILTTADVNCDGDINPVDSLGILRFDAGLAVSQPDDCPLPGTAPIVAAVGSDTETSTSSRGFPALPPMAWLGLAFVLPAVVLTVRRRY